MSEPVAWASLIGEYAHIEWGKKPDDNIHTIPLYAAPPQDALDGMVMVPREPTDAMLQAMHNQIDWCRDEQNTHYIEHESQTSLKALNGEEIGPSGTTCKQDLIDAYRAMLDAAMQEPPK